jgi:DNA polymerase (family 10)
MDNATIARLLEQTADLLEIDGAERFRVFGYRGAAAAVEQTTVDLMAVAADTGRLLQIPGIGKSMATGIQAIVQTGTLPLREELLAKYGGADLLELLKLPSMGPKTIALIWAATGVTSIDQLADAIDNGRLNELPRMGRKQIEKIRKGIDDYRRSAGRFRIDQAAEAARRIELYLIAFPGVERVTPAGSLRRGRETAGDLDLLVTGFACAPGQTSAAVEYVAAYPGIHDLIAKGENKVSFHLADGMQVDVRLLPITSPFASEPSKWDTPSASGRWLASTTNPRSLPPPRKTSTLRSTWTGSRPSCAKIWVKSRRPPSAPSLG